MCPCCDMLSNPNVCEDDSRVELVLVDDGISSKLRKWNSLPPGNCCDEAYPAWLEALEAMEPEPDLVVVDAHTFHAAYAAEELGIPFVTNVPDSFCLLFLLQVALRRVALHHGQLELY
eukprot:1906849-Amphidinium_carterae.1